MTTQTPATAEIEKWLRVRFSQIFDSGSERKTQNPAGVDSRSGTISVTQGRELQVNHNCLETENHSCIVTT